jgi:hypothetical protein
LRSETWSCWLNGPDQPRTGIGEVRKPFTKTIAEPTNGHEFTCDLSTKGSLPQAGKPTTRGVEQRFSYLLQVNHDRPRPEMLYRIAHNRQKLWGIVKLAELHEDGQTEVSNSDQL